MIFLIQQTMIFAIPLLIVALAGVFAERSGIINIALDGIMIFGSFIGAVAVYAIQKSGNGPSGQWLYIVAMLVSAVAGGAFALLLGFSAITLRADQTIGGTALNMLAPAISLFLIKVIYGTNALRMPVGTVTEFMIHHETGTFLDAFTNQAYMSTYLMVVIFIICSIILYKTKFGLRLRACGENPHAAASLGINVYKMRYIGTFISGALGGIGGYIYIATVTSGTAQGTVAGMGFLALAIMIFGNWKPGGIAIGALLFGLLKSISSTYINLDINGDGISALANLGLPSYFYNIIPYVAVLIVLAFTSKNSRAPKAEGIPYDGR